MRIDLVKIEGYRSIRSLECSFDSVTSLVGPNGAGKSNILRALDWFFNGAASDLTEADVFQGASEPLIRVRVDFTGLTDDDREALGEKYCPDGSTDTFTVWRTWSDGVDKITARALAFRPFEEVRRAVGATEKRQRYNSLRTADVGLGLPACSSASAVDAAMEAWERSNPTRLEASEVSDTHFFGAVGQSRLGALFDFVFVSADLRTSDATSPERRSILSRILERAIDRTALDVASQTLFQKLTSELQQLSEKHIGDQLAQLGSDLSNEVAAFTQGRTIALRESASAVKQVGSSVAVVVQGRGAETAPEHQGHGFQRALLLAALSVLSRSKSSESGTAGQMFLAIEEPELYQHPTQTKAFASVLRALADGDGSTTQVAYATHNPHFIHPTYFDQVRRISNPTRAKNPPGSQVTTASLDSVMGRLKGFVSTASVQRRWDQVCLKYLPEALFAERVILVEGDEDAAVIEGMGELNELAVHGVCVAPVSGKSNVMIPFAILEFLGITTIVMVDNDSGKAGRMRANGRSPQECARATEETVRENRALCRFMGEDEADFPVGAVGKHLAFVPDTLETLLASELPGWDLSRRKVIDEGRGVEGKNAATYALASKECRDEPGENLAAILALCTRQTA